METNATDTSNHELFAYKTLKSEDLSTAKGEERKIAIWELVQRGLVYPSPHATFASFWEVRHTPVTKAIIQKLLLDVRATIHEKYGDTNTTAIVGLGFSLYQRWCDEDGTTPPEGMDYKLPEDDSNGRPTSEVFRRSNGKFQDSGADVWFHIKSDKKENCAAVFDFIFQRLSEENCVKTDEDEYICQTAATKSQQDDKKGGKVLGCRFSENLNNPADPISIASHSIIGNEDIDHQGGSFALSQRFMINWEQLHNMTEEQIEDIIGRTSEDVIIPTTDTRSHIKAARARDENGNTTPVLRLGLPFGKSKFAENPELALKGSNIGDEEGIYFAGFAKSVRIFETIMNQQIGTEDGFMRDRLFNNVQSDFGGFFYIPSNKDLGLPAEVWKGKDERKWSEFPGMRWDRLDRHFDNASSNGRMYFNHKNYLFDMSTMDEEKRKKYNPPSTRVLELLAVSFSRWQDNWYFDRKQPEIKHLCVYLAKDFGREKVGEVMGLSVMERKGWAIKMTLRLMTDPDYGYRGVRMMDGVEVEGADTYHIHPLEIIVGAMPNLTLGQGRYTMDFATHDEEIPNFFSGLNSTSGVGHVVPGFDKLLEKGISGLISDIDAKLTENPDEGKTAFYTAAKLSLEGVSEYSIAYSKLAKEMATEMKKGQTAERDNLLQIAARMERIATAKPESLVEAAQLIFTFHSCLHYNGEPTSIGRLDQLLFPFYEKDLAANQITEDEAQEIIDCFWVKLDEKVQQNRMMVEDHQAYGNLAMGGASGPYPQGASLGQWIQQVTVGGVVADNETEAKPAYNTLTKLMLRSSARLPLNAPCLSLRVHKNTPTEYLEEAAKAILSGGAHPLLLNDDKLIEGLRNSGDHVGDGKKDDNNPYTPVSEKADGLWKSEVELRSARNYACDGCYEPMFPGENWFTLGGFTTLNPLECALNQGKTYASAGTEYLRGQNLSYPSKPAQQITSMEDLMEIYYKHFYLLNAKAIDGQLGTFDALMTACPSPLLSTIMDDCIDKGLDLFGGGAKYNVFGPCYIALSSTINSLYAIQKMVFDRETAVTSLPELVQCLICDWGYKMTEPFISSLEGPVRIAAKAERYKKLREVALALPKFGRGNPEVDKLGNDLMNGIAKICVETFTDPVSSTAQKMLKYAKKYGTSNKPFGGFQIQPGVGTFENYLAFGGGSGASADGRRMNETIASDLSPSPSPMDKPVNHQESIFEEALQSYNGDAQEKLTDGAPVDFNIGEDFSEEDLVKVLRTFSDGVGPNIMTITCASTETFEEAGGHPEQYDLLRVRMGGWSEFFTTMFPEQHEQHKRRPLSIAKKEKNQ
jgi:Dyp-type peroxidase family